MSTAARRGQHSLKIDLPNPQSQESPPIAALFVIYFHDQVGYTLGWRRSTPGVDLEGVVEFKSLPSGLHNVKEDLIYFVNKQYAGISAFVNEPTSESERNAQMLAVGVLVPLSFGRLGRSWRHAQALKDFARQLVPDVLKTADLEDYWERYRINEGNSPSQRGSPIESPISLKFRPARRKSNEEQIRPRNRAISDVGALNPSEQNLSPFHPALSLLSFVDTFGPLIFPLQRAALLRRRILLVTHTPIELACNFVYDISILSTLPLAVNDLLSASSPASRLRPFFSIGVHDIPLLAEDAIAMETGPPSPSSTSDGNPEDLGSGWVACTTDEILAVKEDLYDILVTLPPAHAKDATEKIWPKIECPKGTEIKATQRDLRRHRTLLHGLSKYQGSYSDEVDDSSSINSHSALVKDKASQKSIEEDDAPVDDSRIIEAPSWASLAYSSFMWWASAGEARQDTIEEEERDAALFDLPFGPDSTPSARPRSRSSITTFSKGLGTAIPEMALIAYFHRLTSAVLGTLGDLVDASDGDQDEGSQADETETAVFVSSEDLTAMGLDVWSESDRKFVEDILGAYFGRRAEIQGGRVECCGVQVMGG